MKRSVVLACILASVALPVSAEDATGARSDFILHCSGCHGIHGRGTLKGGIPPFQESIEHIAAMDEGRTYLLHVPGVISTDMTNAEIADVLNYILDQWGAGTHHFSAKEVGQRRAIDVRDVVDYRREVVELLAANGIKIADYPWP